MDHPKLIVSNQMEEPISTQRVKRWEEDNQYVEVNDFVK